MEQRKQNEYDILRIIATVLVVFGHCQVFSTANISFPSPDTTLRNILDSLINYIYCFHVPLFFFISGAIYNISCTRNPRYSTPTFLIRNKARRLLLPYALTFILLLLPLRLLLSNYSSPLGVAVDFIGMGDSGHLWFLPVLFLNFVIFSLLQTLLRKRFLVFGAVVLLYLVTLFVPDKFDTSLRYLLWFMLGYFFNEYKEYVTRFKKYSLFLWLFFVAVSIVIYILPLNFNALFSICKNLCVTVTAIAHTYFFVAMLDSYNLSQKIPFIKELSKYSFDIYLYHDIFNFLILFLLSKVFNLSEIGLFLYIVILILKTFGVTVLSIELSIWINKIKPHFNLKRR